MISKRELENLYWSNVAIGLTIGALIALLAPLLAAAYSDARIENVCRGLALPFLFTGTASHCRALLARELRLRSIAIADLAALVFGFSVAVATAKMGWGVGALVAQQVGHSSLLALLLFRRSG